MTLLVSSGRWAGLFLALLAVAGLVARGHGVPAMAGPVGLAAFPVAVCHSGGDDRRAPDAPMADCDACVACGCAHAAAVLVPVGVALLRDAGASVVPAVPRLASARRVAEARIYEARAPPGAA